jgi:hypothetical protein
MTVALSNAHFVGVDIFKSQHLHNGSDFPIFETDEESTRSSGDGNVTRDADIEDVCFNHVTAKAKFIQNDLGLGIVGLRAYDPDYIPSWNIPWLEPEERRCFYCQTRDGRGVNERCPRYSPMREEASKFRSKKN